MPKRKRDDPFYVEAHEFRSWFLAGPYIIGLCMLPAVAMTDKGTTWLLSTVPRFLFNAFTGSWSWSDVRQIGSSSLILLLIVAIIAWMAFNRFIRPWAKSHPIEAAVWILVPVGLLMSGTLFNPTLSFGTVLTGVALIMVIMFCLLKVKIRREEE